MRRKRVSDKEAEAAVLAGMDRHEFCRRFGVHNAIYYAARRRLGIRCPRKEVDREELRRLARSGLSSAKVAEMMGLARRTVERHAREIGVVWQGYYPKVLPRAEWATWENPTRQGRRGVVPPAVFAAIYRERKLYGTLEYLGLSSKSSVTGRLKNLRRKGLIPPLGASQQDSAG